MCVYYVWIIVDFILSDEGYRLYSHNYGYGIIVFLWSSQQGGSM